MNPGKLNSRLHFDDFSVWGKRIVKTKKRQSGQNQKEYEFIVRNTVINEYSTFVCNDFKYIVLTVDQDAPGYLKITCEKAKIHMFYDTCSISRMVETEAENGSDRVQLTVLYDDVPCELVKLQSGSVSDGQQENEINQYYELYVENSVDIQEGDTLDITHKGDPFNVMVTDTFKTHTHQVVSVKLEGEA